MQAVVPLLLFLAVNRLAGLRWAVVAATVWSLKIVIDRRRNGIPLGRFIPIVTASVIIRGAIGAATGSETVYFGLGIATKYAAAAVLFGSIAARRPLAAMAAPYVMDVGPSVQAHPAFQRGMRLVTAIAGVYYLASASFDVWLFQRSDVEGFVIVRFLANWPLSTAALLLSLMTLRSQLAKIPGVAPLSTLIEQRMAMTMPQKPHDGSGQSPDPTTPPT